MGVFLSLGSNVGDRRRLLTEALELLDRTEGVRVVRVSSVYETEPWGAPDQPMFLNVAAEIETELKPLALLNAVKDIEQRLGREAGTQWGPRRIDLDIILWDDRVLELPGLRVPHPEFRRRAFVLTPLAEIAPDVLDPETGSTITELAGRTDAIGAVQRIQD